MQSLLPKYVHVWQLQVKNNTGQLRLLLRYILTGCLLPQACEECGVSSSQTLGYVVLCSDQRCSTWGGNIGKAFSHTTHSFSKISAPDRSKSDLKQTMHKKLFLPLLCSSPHNEGMRRTTSHNMRPSWWALQHHQAVLEPRLRTTNTCVMLVSSPELIRL